ncbi:MAG: ABC transporter ATP-binding protein [Desulfitobacteriaceae bacterium]
MSELLEVKNLCLDVRTREGWRPAIKNLSFKIDQGEILGLVGESGSGKSLTALALLHLLPASARVASGSVLFQGQPILHMSEKQFNEQVRGQGMAYISQNPMTSLSPTLKVGEQMIDGFLAKRRKISKKEARCKALELLEQVGIDDSIRVYNQFPHHLSGGMRQRVMIASAMLSESALLIADEPTTALDVRVQAQILETLLGLKEKRGLSVLLISHDLGVVGKTCDKVMVMYAGYGMEYARQKELFAHAAHPYTQALLEATPSLVADISELRSIPGSIPSVMEEVGGCLFHPRCNYRGEACLSKLPQWHELAVEESWNSSHSVLCHYPLCVTESARRMRGVG